MLVVFVMYIIIFVSFMLLRKSKIAAVMLVTVLAIAFGYAEYKVGYPDRYYNTILCLPAGMIFSLLKPYIDKLVMKNDILWSCGFAGAFAVYYFFYRLRSDNVIYYNLWCLLAIVLLLLFSMKVQIENSILNWFGSHVFSIYILQRIPMIVLSELGFSGHKYMFIITSFVITLAMALLFEQLTDKLDSVIFRKKAIKSS